MAQQAVVRTNGATVAETTVREFKTKIRGQVLQPDDDTYNATRAVWNGMIDKRPALIAQCSGLSDILNSVRFAREHDLLVSVRGGGHNVAGTALCDGGLMIVTLVLVFCGDAYRVSGGAGRLLRGGGAAIQGVG